MLLAPPDTRDVEEIMPDADVPLREYLEERLAGERNRSDAQFLELLSKLETTRLHVLELAKLHADAHGIHHMQNEKAVDKANAVLDQRMSEQNEFRGQLKDQAATFVRRDFLDTALSAVAAELRLLAKANSDRISNLERKEANLSGRLTAMGIGISLMVIVVNIALRFL